MKYNKMLLISIGMIICLYISLDNHLLNLDKRRLKGNETIFNENSKYYKIVQEDNFIDLYYIYSIDGKLLDEGSTDRPIQINLVSNEVIELRFGMGSGISSHKFYDIKNGIISREYQNVLLSSSSLCVHVDDSNLTKLVVEDIFDSEKYYKEFDLNLSKVPTPIEKIEFINNNTKIKISYLEGEEMITKTTILDL